MPDARALLPWNHSTHYCPELLDAMPIPCARALDVGCGQGLLTHLLASRSPNVTGIDLETVPSLAAANPTFIAGDVMTYPFHLSSFDFITVVAALHHLPLRPALARFRELLAPGGTLAILGLYRPATFTDYASNAAAFIISRIVRVVRGMADMKSAQRTPTTAMAEIRQAALLELPGAVILRRRLFFRYTLVWQNLSFSRPIQPEQPGRKTL